MTGEGSVDYQTVYNKAPIGVARLARARGIPVVAIVGSLGERYREVHDHGIDAVLAITSRPMTLEEASERVDELVTDAAEQAMRLMAAGTVVVRRGTLGADRIDNRRRRAAA